MRKFYRVSVTSQTGVKELFCDHVFDVEQLVDALHDGEVLSVSPLLLTDVSRGNADSFLHSYPFDNNNNNPE